MFDGDDMGKKLNENQSVYELCDWTTTVVRSEQLNQK